MTLIAALAIGFVAVVLYEFGTPGAPESWGNDGSIQFYAPKDIKAKIKLTTEVDQSTSPASDTSATERLEVQWTSEEIQRFYLLVDLDEEARSVDYIIESGPGYDGGAKVVDVAKSSDEDVWPYDSDWVVIEVWSDESSASSGHFTLLFNMSETPAYGENARFVVDSPSIYGMARCTSYDGFRKPILNKDNIDQATSCTEEYEQVEALMIEDEVSVEISSSGLGPIRSDYAYPSNVSLGGDAFRGMLTAVSTISWLGKGAISPIGSFTDLSLEVKAQRALFFSGIFAGLASGLLPFGIELAFLQSTPTRGKNRRKLDWRRRPRRRKVRKIMASSPKGRIQVPDGLTPRREL